MTDPETIRTYDENAELFAARFRHVGPRNEAIDFACRFIQTDTPEDARTVVEVGCSAGRDAVPLSQRFANYYGFDPSEGLIDIARRDVGPLHPNAHFSVSDALSYSYPPTIDAVFAFASLHHLPKHSLAAAFSIMARNMQKGAVLLATLRESDRYERVIMDGEHGEVGQRTFYYYPAGLVDRLAAAAALNRVDLAHPDDPDPNIPSATLRWLRIILRKEA